VRELAGPTHDRYRTLPRWVKHNIGKLPSSDGLLESANSGIFFLDEIGFRD